MEFQLSKPHVEDQTTSKRSLIEDSFDVVIQSSIRTRRDISSVSYESLPTMLTYLSSKIAQLPTTIATYITKVDCGLEFHGRTSPSFDTETPPKLDLPQDISGAF